MLERFDMTIEKLQLRYKAPHRDVPFGLVGDPSPYQDIRGQVIHVGDQLTFEFQGEKQTGIMVCNDRLRKYFIFGLVENNLTDFENIELSISHQTLDIGDIDQSFYICEMSFLE